jgi:hypothetical protein
VANGDCSDPSASTCNTTTQTCVPCVNNADCAGIVADGVTLGVCDAGQCVECTSTSFASCPGVCDSAARRCTNVAQGTAASCQPCIADAQCAGGGLCVTQTFGAQGVGEFCFPGGASGCATNPFVQSQSATSIDGATGTICGLAETTCVALNQFLGVGTPCASAVDCGVPGVNDGQCATRNAQLLCSVPCAGGNTSCPGASTCSIVAPLACQ